MLQRSNLPMFFLCSMALYMNESVNISHGAARLSADNIVPHTAHHDAGREKAADVARGVTRLFARHAIWMMGEYSLPNKKRADLLGLDKAGNIIIIEIKVAKADLLGDQKWTEYLDFCDQFYWALSPNLDSNIVNGELFMPQRTGLIVADQYDAEILRPASRNALAPARRTKLLKDIAHNALRRAALHNDPHIIAADAV